MPQHELLDVVDLQPAPGEYVGCRHPFESFQVFGVEVQAWHRIHAQRLAVQERWGSHCECCNHHIRYAHITQDETGAFHCFGATCLNVVALGEVGARRLEYSRKIEQKGSGGYCATFTVPQKFWEIKRECRPQYARLWKGKAYTRRGIDKGYPQWKLSIWGDSFEECLEHCMLLHERLGVKLV